MIPACKGDAGDAIVDREDAGSNKVSTTPSANTAVSTTNMSGRRFTFPVSSLSYLVTVSCVFFCAAVYVLPLMGEHGLHTRF